MAIGPRHEILPDLGPGDAPHDPDGVSERRVCGTWRAGATDQIFRMRGVIRLPCGPHPQGARIPLTCRWGRPRFRTIQACPKDLPRGRW